MPEPKNPSEESLNVFIDDSGRLTITIGIDALPIICEPNVLELIGADSMRVTDMKEVASAIVDELLREEEDGTTPVHRMLDQAFADAIAQGCEGVETEEESGEQA